MAQVLQLQYKELGKRRLYWRVWDAPPNFLNTRDREKEAFLGDDRDLEEARLSMVVMGPGLYLEWSLVVT